MFPEFLAKVKNTVRKNKVATMTINGMKWTIRKGETRRYHVTFGSTSFHMNDWKEFIVFLDCELHNSLYVS